MKNLKDAKTKIFPSKTRGGKELATPPHAINSDMSEVVDDATSAMNDTYNDASTLLDDDDVPLGDFLDEQIARVRENEINETDEELENEKS